MRLTAHSGYTCICDSSHKSNSQTLSDSTFNILLQDSSIVLGVSDPRMDTEDAYAQAKLRAAALISLNRGFYFSKLSNIYKNDYTDATEIKNSLMVSVISDFDTSEINVLDCVYSELGECFVFAKAKPQSDSLNTQEEFYLHFMAYCSEKLTSNSIKYGKVDFDITNISSNDDINYAEYFIDGRREILSLWDGGFIKTGNIFHEYPDSKSHSENFNCTEKITQSFWSAYLNAIVRNLLFHFNRDAKNSNTSRQYKNKLTELNRTVADEEYQLNISDININDNHLNLNIDFVPIENLDL